MQKRTFKIYRYDPDKDAKPYMQTVEIELEGNERMLLDALRAQDMFLAGSFLMFLATLVVIGTLLSDLALAALDPRIRLSGGNTR